MARGPCRPGPGTERGTGARGESPLPSPREGRLDRCGLVRPHGVQEAARATERRSPTGGGREPSAPPASRRREDRGVATARRRSFHGAGRKRLVLVGESVAEKAGKRKRLDELTI